MVHHHGQGCWQGYQKTRRTAQTQKTQQQRSASACEVRHRHACGQVRGTGTHRCCRSIRTYGPGWHGCSAPRLARSRPSVIARARAPTARGNPAFSPPPKLTGLPVEAGADRLFHACSALEWKPAPSSLGWRAGDVCQTAGCHGRRQAA